MTTRGDAHSAAPRAVNSDAASLHRDAIVIDTNGAPGPSVHNDAMLARLDALAAAGTPSALAIVEIEAMGDDALIAGDLDGVWAGWERSGVDAATVTLGAFGDEPFTYDNAMRDIAAWQRKFDALDRYVKIERASDVESAHDDGRFGVMLAFQNTTHIGDDLANLKHFYDLGLRVIQLTYNSHNLVGSGCTEPDPHGLTPFGRDVVAEMNRLGIVVDVSHCSRPTQLDAVDASDVPIAISHGFARAVHEHDRGASDEVLKAVGTDGYVGVVAVPFFLSFEPVVTLEHLTAHVAHIADLIGADHVGIGTDWAPPMPTALQAMYTAEMDALGFRDEHRVDWSATIEELQAWEDWPSITQALLDRGFSADEVRGIIGGNFLRYFRGVCG